MKTGLKYITLFSIAIGLLAIAINTIFGAETITYIQTTKVGGLTFIKFNFADYIRNLATSIQQTAVLELKWQSRVWDTDFTLDAINNNLAYIANIFIFLGNCFMYPLRIGAYLTNTLLAIIGVQSYNVQSTDNIYWLNELIEFLITYAQEYV